MFVRVREDGGGRVGRCTVFVRVAEEGGGGEDGAARCSLGCGGEYPKTQGGQQLWLERTSPEYPGPADPDRCHMVLRSQKRGVVGLKLFTSGSGTCVDMQD